MGNSTKITIVTITFNSEKTIEQTILSVVQQQYSSLEYWIIDGDSNDSTIDIVKRYATHYPCIKYLSEKDNGISSAFNKGISLASGDIIGLINSDDCLAPNALKTIDKVYRETQADVIYGNAIAVDPENGLKMLKLAGEPAQLKYEMPCIHQSCFIKKSVYEKIGKYSEEYKICMDYDMLVRIFKSGFVFERVDEVFSIFQYGGTSCEHPIRTINEDMKIAAKYGLPTFEIWQYKIKHVIVCVIKIILTRIHLWGYLYKKVKSDGSLS